MIKVTITQVLESQNEVTQLRQTAFPPKAKYWINRICDLVMKAGTEFAKKRNDKIVEYGEQVYLHIPSMEEQAKGAKGEWRPVAEGQDLTGLQTQFQVKPEHREQYTAEVIAMAEAEPLLEIPFDKISLDAMGNTPTEIDLAKVFWMIDEGTNGLRVVK